MKSFFLLSIVLIVLAISCSQKEPADKIYINAKIWTGDTLQPNAKTIALKGNKILFIGDDYTAYKSGNTTIIDCAGQMIVPGFISRHCQNLYGKKIG